MQRVARPEFLQYFVFPFLFLKFLVTLAPLIGTVGRLNVWRSTLTQVENSDQVALRKWILAGLAIPEVVALKGDAGYLLNNMIAKYTLAADNYAISNKALEEFKAQNVDLNRVYARRVFYGKQGGKNPFIYEHTVPARVIRQDLLKCGGDSSIAEQILAHSGEVAIILRSEDAQLRELGLSSRMPEGWKIGDDHLARYKAVGIALSHEILYVSGAICR